eukprot:1185365-Prorocentrum_minimum.AAC.2
MIGGGGVMIRFWGATVEETLPKRLCVGCNYSRLRVWGCDVDVRGFGVDVRSLPSLLAMMVATAPAAWQWSVLVEKKQPPRVTKHTLPRTSAALVRLVHASMSHAPERSFARTCGPPHGHERATHYSEIE